MRKLNWGIMTTLALIGISIGAILEVILGERISPFLVPRPTQLFSAFIEEPVGWGRAIVYTTSLSLCAALVSVLAGVLVGAVASFFQLWAVDRWAQLIWSIPLIAIAVYLLLVVGFGWAYGLILATFLGFYPIEKHTFDYCSQKSEGVTSLCAAFGLSRLREFVHLRVPGSLRSLSTALSQALPLCFIGETMGEYTAAKISEFSIGLGGFLRNAQNNSVYPRLWLSIIFMMSLVFSSGEVARIVWDKLYPYSSEREALR